MLASAFAQNYNPNSSYETRFPGEIQDLVAPCRDWSMQIGRLLHDRLSGIAIPDKRVQETFNGYVAWINTDFSDINAQLLQYTSEAGQHASTEINFHRLSTCLATLWPFALVPSFDDGTPPTRIQVSKMSQYNLAYHGINFCSSRFDSSEIDSDYAYLQEEHATTRIHNEALMTEYDAGAVLLGVARQHSGMLVLPAPAQFEHSKRKAFNVDWIVFDPKHDAAVGVQVKTHVTDHDRATYDESVVLLDGDYDLGNAIFHRDRAGTSHDRRFTWGGMICAQHVIATPLQQQAKDMRQFYGNRADLTGVLKNRTLAQRIIGKNKIKIKDSIKIVDEKVMAKL